ncbi:MAG: T9SS type A sorting domain-containing protein [Bacteroidetes bacterium]|nr:T9SS type A sorting domain-containing protein [Bacteroidota bacterium]
MSKFIIDGNPLIKCMPSLKKYVGSKYNFSIRGTGIQCFPLAIEHTGIITAIDSMPICNLFNANGCPLGWNIQGNIYMDANNDCVQQINEVNLHSLKLNLFQSGNLVQSGYFMSNYSFDTDLSTYTVAGDSTGLPFTFACPRSGDTTLNITALDSLKKNINFGFKCKSGFDLAAWSIVGNRFRPAWNEMVNIKAGDMANALGGACASGVSGIVNVTITGPAKFVSQALSALTPSSSSSNSATWNIADFITVNSTKDFNIIIQPDTTAQAGQQICITVSVSPTTGDNNPTNNVLTQCFEVRTSYDPNDKAVYPSGDILPEQDWLTYTIRFQNTGNDTAIHVQIIDTLDSDIDMASFKLLAYSHENITQILEGGIVKFNFPNIYLPDSNVNEPLSHGYIQYKVKLKDNLPIGTNISNTAYIYFDFNAPVVTNTTTNTISTATAVSPSPSGRGGVGLFPNPAHNTLTILTSGSNENITITNLLGELMFHERTLNGRKEIDISQWPQGMYFVNQQKFVKQ